MHQDKKREELEQIVELEIEKKLDQEEELETEVAEKSEEKEEVIKTEGDIETWEVLEKKKRKEAIFEMVLFFVLGVLVGVTLKTEAVKRITIGFNDYQITKPAQSYDISALKKNLDDQMAAQQAAQQQQQQSQIQNTPQQ
ncbi:MAG: hypothetical protein PHW24_03485 [Candidatus Moranbacteria bacterium]|nr:hypothetical protein [Candidatus Moranbacteria bacterium]